jgi:antitoxin (DNA-binding transcriptional repressor) of toxin-antitoxin stability system
MEQPGMTALTTRQVRQELSDTLNRVCYAGERIQILRRDKVVAVLVSPEDAALLEDLEDQIDIEAAREALADMKRARRKPIPLAKIKKKLGLA